MKKSARKSAKGFRWNLENLLRMLHALVQEDIREAFKERYTGEQREEMDGRNSAVKPPSVEALIAMQM